MLKRDVLSHYKGSPTAVARALGITKGAVCQWRARVPLHQALRLQEITQGDLKVDSEAYGIPEISLDGDANRESA